MHGNTKLKFSATVSLASACTACRTKAVSITKTNQATGHKPTEVLLQNAVILSDLNQSMKRERHEEANSLSFRNCFANPPNSLGALRRTGVIFVRTTKYMVTLNNAFFLNNVTSYIIQPPNRIGNVMYSLILLRRLLPSEPCERHCNSAIILSTSFMRTRSWNFR